MSTATYTVSNLISQIRLFTLYKDPQQVSDATILNYLNDFINQDFSQHVQSLYYKTTYNFVTEAGIDKYQFPVNAYPILTGVVFVSGIRCNFFQDANIFWQYWAPNQQSTLVGTGNGGTIYNLVLPAPMIRSFTNIFGNTQPGVFISTTVSLGGTQLTLVDDGNGNFTGDGTGTLNYFTGVAEVTFNEPTSMPIYCNNTTYQAGQPLNVLFYDSVLTFRNVPNQAYQVSMEVYVNPARYPNVNVPVILNSSYYLFAFGAAEKLLVNNKDLDQLRVIRPLFEEQKLRFLRNTYRQHWNTPTPTIYNSGYTGPVWQTNVPYN